MTRQVISFVEKFFRLPRYDRLLLVEATLWLMIAEFAITVLPFPSDRTIGSTTDPSVGAPAASTLERSEAHSLGNSCCAQPESRGVPCAFSKVFPHK